MTARARYRIAQTFPLHAPSFKSRGVKRRDSTTLPPQSAENAKGGAGVWSALALPAVSGDFLEDCNWGKMCRPMQFNIQTHRYLLTLLFAFQHS